MCYQPIDAFAEGARLVDDREGAANEENEDDDGGGVDQSSRDGDEGVERTERVRGHVVVCTGYDHRSAGRRIVAMVVLAGGKHVGQHRRQQRAADEQRERVG